MRVNLIVISKLSSATFADVVILRRILHSLVVTNWTHIHSFSSCLRALRLNVADCSAISCYFGHGHNIVGSDGQGIEYNSEMPYSSVDPAPITDASRATALMHIRMHNGTHKRFRHGFIVEFIASPEFVSMLREMQRTLPSAWKRHSSNTIPHHRQ